MLIILLVAFRALCNTLIDILAI